MRPRARTRGGLLELRPTHCGHDLGFRALEGLDYDYRDFYDGLGEAGLELIFAATAESYLARRSRDQRAAGASGSTSTVVSPNR